MKKRALSVILSLTMLFSIVPIGGLIALADDNTSFDIWDASIAPITPYGDDYYVDSAAQLAWVAKSVNDGTTDFYGKTIILSVNIDLNQHEWISIGSASNRQFKGSFDGQGHIIRNFRCEISSLKISGLFGFVYADNSYIKNINFDNGNIIRGNREYGPQGSGGIIGNLVIAESAEFALTDCYWNGAIITGDSSSGGLVGQAKLGSSSELRIEHCVFFGEVISTPHYMDPVPRVGGLVGSVNTSENAIINISNSYTRGTVTSTGRGGLMAHSYVSAGGLIGTVDITSGSNIQVNIDKCYSNCDVTATTNYSGYCSARAGGLIGEFNSDSLYITASFATGTLFARSRDAYLGGLVGQLGLKDTSTFLIQNCYVKAAMKAEGSNGNGDIIGGIVGATGGVDPQSATIENCYSTGSATASWVAGIVGTAPVDIQITNSYFDMTALGIPETMLKRSLGFLGGSSPLTTKITDSYGLSDEEIKLKNSYSHWDFNSVWSISSKTNDGMPYLQAVGLGEELITESLIDRVKKYTAEFESEELAAFMEAAKLGNIEEFNQFADYYNSGVLSQKERWDYSYLMDNEIYLSWQFKEHLKKPGVRITLGLSGLVFNDEMTDYLTLHWVEKDKYKTALEVYMKTNAPTFEVFGKIEETLAILEGISHEVVSQELTSYIAHLKDVLPLCRTTEEIDTLINSLTQQDEWSTLELGKFAYASQHIGKALGVLSDFVEVTDITIDGIIALTDVGAVVNTYKNYEAFLHAVTTDSTLPAPLRYAAFELKTNIADAYLQVTYEIFHEVFTFLENKLVLKPLGELIDTAIAGQLGLVGYLGTFSLSSKIVSFLTGIDDIVNSSSYVECYAILSEKYSKILQSDAQLFRGEGGQTFENAYKFYYDYEMLRTLRTLCEETYYSMLSMGMEHDASDIWDYNVKRLMREITIYEEARPYILNTISNLKSRAFTMNDDVPRHPIVRRDPYTNKIVVACPVDIQVYDANNVLLYEVVNHVVSKVHDEMNQWPLSIYTLGEITHLEFPGTSVYEIVLLPYAEGEMDVLMSTRDNGGNTIKRTNYEGVAISIGSNFGINTSDSSEKDYHKLIGLVGQAVNTGKSFEQQELDSIRVNVDVNIDGEGFVWGDGEYYALDRVCLLAYASEGFAFDGWYEAGQKASAESEYSFIAEENRFLTVKFIPSDDTHTVTFRSNGGIWIGGGNMVQEIPEGGDAIAPMLVRHGYIFDGWVGGKFTNVTGDVTITARWTQQVNAGGSNTPTAPAENFTDIGSGSFAQQPSALIAQATLATQEKNLYRVNASSLNIRLAASASTKKIGSLKRDTIVDVLDIANGFAKISQSGISGWVSMQYLVKVSNAGAISVGNQYITTSNLRVRANASSLSAILGTLRKGADVSVTGVADNGFVSISYNNRQAFVHGAYIRIK